MGQVAFDTQEFVETLENAGLPKNQARAISIAVRKSHEVADVATKADIAEVNRNIADVRKDTAAQFEKTNIKIDDVRKDLSAEIANVRKDIEHRFEKVEAQIVDSRKDTAAQIALLRKDVESISTWLLIKMAGMMAAIIGIATAIMKFF
ncbi:hypothetical protein JZM24_13030 [Candidatus Sodalis endolongispinus]|uniref:Phage protein n=1 Tax=Candidatus Sodalis endolongispinus TaxID=2812662 RepID=A0ABS5YCX8_9GAMM|nr:hypothetical protein [Candidatus Sodalis endolongispinus]MBT9432236.1 hypothetical protein [Candidatus Sodalis endolongispinus]MBT9432822.1 hypothetical protein [Candidatus Sodalis endolongispinus]